VILKLASVEAHNLWIASEKPNNGVINAIRREAKYKYKLALRHAQKIETCKVDDELSRLYLKKDVDGMLSFMTD